MKTIYLRAGKQPFQFTDALQSLQKNIAGTNVGNMLFQQSTFRTLFRPDQKIKINGYSLKARLVDELNEKASAVVLPLANQFRPNYADRLEALADVIRKLKVPVVVVGVGCQSNLNYDLSLLAPINRQVRNFVGAILDRSASIGVRGECTANYLNSLGFNDVDVIGCPSMFMYGNTFPEIRLTKIDRRSKIAVNISAIGEQSKFATGLDRMGAVIDEIIRQYDDVVYIPQENRSTEDLLFFRDRPTPEHSQMSPDLYTDLRNQGRIKAFIDPKTWIDYLRTRDFAIGTRLHGGIAALLAGTPAHLVAHDSRTLEIAEFFEIPHSKITTDKSLDPAAAYDRSDFARLIRGHAARFDNFKTFLRKNGLSTIYDEGQSGAEFDNRLEGAVLSPMISSTPTLGDKELDGALAGAALRDPGERDLLHRSRTLLSSLQGAVS
jgi:hypothetical protein